MKLLIATSAAALMVSMAHAEMAPAANPFVTTSAPMSFEASDFIGKRVYASEAQLEADEYAGVQQGWEDIGEINDVILTRDGQVNAVLVDIGGFLGIGERQVAVDMNAVRFVNDSATTDNLDDFFLVLNANRAVLEGAPAYEMSDDQAAADPSTMKPMPAPTETAAATETAAPMAADPANDLAALKAEDIQGSPVYDANNEWIGEVSELIVSPEGKVLNAVIDVGGFLGIGEKPVALELANLEIISEDGEKDDLKIMTKMTKDQLEALPNYEG